MASKATSAGGLGGTVTETVPVTPGETLYVQVGAAGGTGGAAGLGGGGTGRQDRVARDRGLRRGRRRGVGRQHHPGLHALAGRGRGRRRRRQRPQRGQGSLHLNGGDRRQRVRHRRQLHRRNRRRQQQFPGGQGRAGGTDPLNEGGSGGTNTEMSAPSGSSGSTLAGGNGGNGGPGAATRAAAAAGAAAATSAEAAAGVAASTAPVAAAAAGPAGPSPAAAPSATAWARPARTGRSPSPRCPRPHPPVAFSVNTAASSTTVSWGQPVALTATLPADATGDVGFYDDVNGGCDGHTGSGSLCQGLGTATLYDGTATLPNPDVALEIGTHELHASWGGDTHYNPGDSNAVTVTVTKAAPDSHPLRVRYRPHDRPEPHLAGRADARRRHRDRHLLQRHQPGPGQRTHPERVRHPHLAQYHPGRRHPPAERLLPRRRPLQPRPVQLGGRHRVQHRQRQEMTGSVNQTGPTRGTRNQTAAYTPPLTAAGRAGERKAVLATRSCLLTSLVRGRLCPGGVVTDSEVDVGRRLWTV